MSAEPIKIPTQSGEPVDAVLHLPNGKGPHPVVIVAPGAGYHMGLPLTEGLASRVAEIGAAALRFDWRAFTAGDFEGQADRSRGRADIEAVIGFVHDDVRMDDTRIVLAGKSMGSVVSYATFRERAEVRGALLLTPPSVPQMPFAQNYPGLASEERPLAFIVGNADPLCPLSDFYGGLAGVGNNVAAVVLAGDHSLALTQDAGGGDHEALYTSENLENANRAVEAALYWLNQILAN